MTLSNADKLRFAEVEDRITREFGDSDTMDFLEYLKTQGVENRLRQVRQDSLEESIEFLVNECGELQKEVNEYRQQEETRTFSHLLGDQDRVIVDFTMEVATLEALNKDLRGENERLKAELEAWVESQT